MLNALSFQPVSMPFQAEEAGGTEQPPTAVDAHASRGVGSSGDTPPAQAVPPWLEPSNFEFLRRVAHAVAARGSGSGQ